MARHAIAPAAPSVMATRPAAASVEPPTPTVAHGPPASTHLEPESVDDWSRPARSTHQPVHITLPPETIRPGAMRGEARASSWLVAAAVFGVLTMLGASAAMAPREVRFATTAMGDRAPHELPLPKAASPAADPTPNPASDESATSQTSEVTTTGDEDQSAATRPRSIRGKARPRSQFLAMLATARPSASNEPGTLVARARGGNCRFWIDGVMSGEGRVVRVPARPGAHKVACRGEDGAARVQRVEVVAGGIAVAAFYMR
jgi:hypothetical protein